MIRINLLAEAKGGKRGAARTAAAGPVEGAPSLGPHIGILLLVLLPTIGWAGWLFMQNKTLAADVETKKKELEEYKGVRDKVKDLEKRKEEYSAKVDQIKALKEQQSMPVKLMNYLVEILPDGAWYQKLVQKGGAISLEGKAKSIKTISMFSDNLVGQKAFGDIQMGDISQETVAGEQIYSFKCKFSYGAALKPPDKAKAAPAAKTPAKPAPAKKSME